MTLEELVAAAVKATGMSDIMVKRSAAARAKAQGSTIEAVLAEWAGVPLPAAAGGGEPAAAAAPAAPAPAEPAPAPTAAAPAAPAPAEPAPAPTAAAPAAPAPAEPAPAPAAAAPAAPAPAEPAPAPTAAADAPAAASAPADAAAPEAAAPEEGAEAAPAEDAEDAAPVEEEAPTEAAEATEPVAVAAAPAEAPEPEASAGVEVEESGEETSAAPRRAPDQEPVVLREVVPAGAIPRWLAAMFVAVPLFALAYIGFLPNGPGCGDAGRLAVDPVSGEMVNCDGSAIGDEGEIDYFELGQEMYASNGCFACHGEGGGGSPSGPAFSGGGLLATFPEGQCSTHVEWVRLGTAQWPDPTYGATQKPVGGFGSSAMPSFGTALSDHELKAVALYERVAFGGQELEAAKLDCLGPAIEDPPAEG